MFGHVRAVVGVKHEIPVALGHVGRTHATYTSVMLPVASSAGVVCPYGSSHDESPTGVSYAAP